MFRLIFSFNRRLSHSVSFPYSSAPPLGKKSKETPIFRNDPTETPKENLQLDPLATSLNEYKKAMEDFHNEKYESSEESFKRTLSILENSKQANSDTMIHILKKLVMNSNLLRKYKQSESLLERLVEIYQEREKTSPVLLYNEYNNLILHCFRFNIDKAILLSKALVSDKEKKVVPLNFQKIFLFNLGTGYLLKGNYIDAKSRLRECLTLQPNPILKGYALNNLALASWWHKAPLTPEEEELNKMSQQNYASSQIDNDFSNVIPLFKNAIANLEDVEHNKDFLIKEKLKNLLDKETIMPKDKNIDVAMENKDSGTPVLNIGEFLFLTNPEKRAEATFWFRYAIKFFEKNDPANIDLCLIYLALFSKSSSQLIQAEGLFRRVLEMLEKNDNYNKVLCLLLYGKMLKEIPKREQEGEKMITNSKELAATLPPWSNKLNNISFPKLDL